MKSNPPGSRKQSALSEFQKKALQAYTELLQLKNYSQNTISNYTNWFTFFMVNFPGRKPSTLTKNEIMDFLVDFRKGKEWSATVQNQLINAIHPVGIK